MRKITCDFCGKNIDSRNDELYEEYGWYEDKYYDLCENCEEIYNKINHEMSEYRNKQMRLLEEKIEKVVKQKLEKLKSKQKNAKFEE